MFDLRSFLLLGHLHDFVFCLSVPLPPRKKAGTNSEAPHPYEFNPGASTGFSWGSHLISGVPQRWPQIPQILGVVDG